MNDFEKNMYSLYKDKGIDWLQTLPELVTGLAHQWNLSNIISYDNLSYNYVAAAKQYNKDVVLKVGLDYIGLQREADVLKTYNGNGCVKLYDSNHEALLIERCIPGITLKNSSCVQVEKCEAVVSIVKKLHSVLYNKKLFPTLASWTDNIYKTWDDIPLDYRLQAQKFHSYLLQTTEYEVLLHGDLHYENILQHDTRWMAIDPKGIIGDPVYELSVTIISTATSYKNTYNLKDFILQDIACYSQLLNMDKKRLAKWSFVHAILAWMWALEENTSIASYPTIAQACKSILENEIC